MTTIAGAEAAPRGPGRRRLLRAAFWAAMGSALLAALRVTGDFAWPRETGGFGGVITVSPQRLPPPGAPPVRIFEARAYLVNLLPGEGAWEESGRPATTGGYLALWQKCPHLGCTVPWLDRYDFKGSRGWFRCPCHQSTYTKAGIRVWGPAPRPMDSFAIAFDEQGRLLIDTGTITLGGEDNPLRAVPHG